MVVQNPQAKTWTLLMTEKADLLMRNLDGTAHECHRSRAQRRRGSERGCQIMACGCEAGFVYCCADCGCSVHLDVKPDRVNNTDRSILISCPCGTTGTVRPQDRYRPAFHNARLGTGPGDGGGGGTGGGGGGAGGGRNR